MTRPIEPGLLRIFRYYTGVAMGYFAILWAYAFISSGWEWSTQVQFLANFGIYFALWGYLTWHPVERRLKNWYLPLGLLLATIFSVLGNFVYLLDPSKADMNFIINRSWLWLPVLFVPLVLIAWQYGFPAVLAFTVFTNGLELIVLLLVVDQISLETMPLIGVPFIRAFAFGIVGYIVNNLMNTQRLQRRKLLQANARLGQYASTLEQLATSRERNRLASELHDTVAHTLSGLAINLEAIKTVIPEDQPGVHEMLDHALHTTRFGLDETRRSLKALRAGPLEDMGLRLAVARLVQTAAERAAIPIEWICPDEFPLLAPDVEQAIYRITQEALENTIRHANASQAQVQLSFPDSHIDLIIRDNGIGFETQARTENGFGLRGLRERASAVGGQINVSSKPGQGTQIHFSWEQYNDD